MRNQASRQGAPRCTTTSHDALLCAALADRRDLVFPHHENELAQSRAAAGTCSCGHDHAGGDGGEARDEFVRYWVHNGAAQVRLPTARACVPRAPSLRASPPAPHHHHMAAASRCACCQGTTTSPRLQDSASRCVSAGFVNVDSEKMSKSLGNFFTIRCACCACCDPLKQRLLACPTWAACCSSSAGPQRRVCNRRRLCWSRPVQGGHHAVPPPRPALVPCGHAVPPAHQLHPARPGGGARQLPSGCRAGCGWH